MAIRKRGVNEGDDPDMAGADTGEGVPSFKKGTKRVPKTGLAKLHEGEAVIPAAKNPFSKEQIAEDTDRKMRGLPQVHGAAMEDEADDEPEGANADMAGVAGAAPAGAEGDEDEPAIEDMSHEELCQTVTDQAQTIASLQDDIATIKQKLGISDDEQAAPAAQGEDLDVGFGG